MSRIYHREGTHIHTICLRFSYPSSSETLPSGPSSPPALHPGLAQRYSVIMCNSYHHTHMHRPCLAQGTQRRFFQETELRQEGLRPAGDLLGQNLLPEGSGGAKSSEHMWFAFAAGQEPYSLAVFFCNPSRLICIDSCLNENN